MYAAERGIEKKSVLRPNPDQFENRLAFANGFKNVGQHRIAGNKRKQSTHGILNQQDQPPLIPQPFGFGITPCDPWSRHSRRDLGQQSKVECWEAGGLEGFAHAPP